MKATPSSLLVGLKLTLALALVAAKGPSVLADYTDWTCANDGQCPELTTCGSWGGFYQIDFCSINCLDPAGHVVGYALCS